MKTRKVREVREERIGKKSAPLVGFLAVIVVGYFVFFTSKLWLPDIATLKSARRIIRNWYMKHTIFI